MSNRRSPRLANKNPKGETGPSNDLVYEAAESQHFRLKRARTPRVGLRKTRARTKSGSSTTSTSSTTPETETGRTAADGSPPPGKSPSVFTQDRFLKTDAQVCKPDNLNIERDKPDDDDVDTGFDFESSIGNESLFRALDQLEEKHGVPLKNSDNVQPVDPPSHAVSDDVFGDDGEDAMLLEAFPATPPNQLLKITPSKSRSRKRSRPSIRLDLDKAVSPNPAPVQENAQQLIPVEDVENVFKEPAQKKSRRQSKSSGEKKSKKAGPTGKKTKKKGKFKLAFTNRKAIKELANSASNELSLNDLSLMSHEEKLLLSSWGLPQSALNNYKRKGITTLFEWQLKCLENANVMEGKNLLYSAPTSAGKTLVSEILMIKRVLELGRKAIMILPFVSVAREKVYSLQSIFGDAGVRVEGFMGSVNPPGGFKAVDIAVCTIEKANSLINKLLEEGALSDLGTIVVDELHLIGDPHRGYLLELLLTKILYMTSIKNPCSDNSMNLSNNTSLRSKRYNIQIIGMSATLPNLNVLAEWLNAELSVTDFRPVPLKEMLKVEDEMLDESLSVVRKVKTEDIPIKIEGDTDDIVYLALETVLNGFSVLIFCPTKVSVESIASKIAVQFLKIGTSTEIPDIGERLRNQLDGTRIKSVLEQLKQCPGGVDNVLEKTVMFGIGYHHAGLTYENRDIVESAFKRGILRVIVATSTLSAGVNLPARRVMIVSPLVFTGKTLDTMTYRQMCGRAGRNGIDTEGESILICPPKTRDQGIQLYRGEMPIVRSALLGTDSLTSSMKRALLEVIASGIATLISDVKSYAKCTFLFHSLDNGLYESEEISCSQMNKESTVDECLKYLVEQDFIRLKHFEQEDKPDEYMPTQLGSACLASSLSPDDGIIVYKELSKARECFVLENELHVIYQVTPIYVSDSMRNIQWQDYFRIYENLNLSERKVADLVGVREAFIMKAMIGTASWRNESQRPDMAIHQRFYAAMALSDLVNEKSLDEVSKKYSLNKGILQNLQQAASTFAGMITAFCARLEWKNLELLLSQFQERLEFGVQRELCDLVRLDCLNGQRARVLYDAGLKTIMELAAADAAQVEQILHKATPFRSGVHGGRESTVWMIGKDTLTEAEAAQKIVNQARTFIQMEHGLRGNIQFAFANKDNADTSAKGVDRRTSSKSEPDSDVEEEQEQKDDVDEDLESNDDHQDLVPSQSKFIEQVTKAREDPDIEEIFSQRPVELEASLRIPQIAEGQMNINTSKDMFEDSFPEIVSTNISSHYSKTEDKPETPKPYSSFSIRHHVDRMSQLHERRQQHSTPLGNTKSHRFTLKPEEYTSPVRRVDLDEALHREKEEIHAANKLESDAVNDVLNLSNGILAELDNAFDTFHEGPQEPSINLKDFEESMNTSPNATPNRVSVMLSESDAAAMRAIADDSNFESEELFPVVETNRNENEEDEVREQKDSPSAPIPSPTQPSKMADLLDGLDEEDFILTQAPGLNNEESDEDETFEESDTEATESTWATESEDKSSTFSSSLTQDGAILESEVMVGGKMIIAKMVHSVEQIPSAFFSASAMLGFGLKMAVKKTSTTSLSRQGIGARVLGRGSAKKESDDAQQRQSTIALYNGRGVIWVIPFSHENEIAVSSKRKNLEGVFKKVRSHECALAIFRAKDKLKSLVKVCGHKLLSKFPPPERIWDPRIAQWMWDFDEDDFNLSEGALVKMHLSEAERSVPNKALDKEIQEAFFAWKVMNALKGKLETEGLWEHFTKNEMPASLPLLLMELNGFGLDAGQMTKLRHILQFKSAVLELKAFQLAGRQFNLGSPKDVQQILYKEIGLKQPKGTKGVAKDVLLKLVAEHKLPGIIIEYRKINGALNNFIIKFQQERNLETGRVHGHYNYFTATGRVNMSEPSLQCIPRDFDLSEFQFTPNEIAELKDSCKIKFGSKLTCLFQVIDMNKNLLDSSVLHGIHKISMRNAFIPCSSEFVILTADYSQLELRILAHLSGDQKLLDALNKGTDVFVEIATEWKKLPKHKITDSIRQEAKSIVYGVIYGMCAKTLADQLEIEERAAIRLKDQFMKTYDGVRAFLDEAKKLCGQRGYIETISGRRRYLPLIKSSKVHEKSKAERQAVNSQIQGSAADLVKTAMSKIQFALSKKYPNNALTVEWTKDTNARISLYNHENSKNLIKGLDNVVCMPILNLHDELIYEARRTHVHQIACIVKQVMESSLKLKVKLPVVVKTGESWGSLEIYENFC